MDLADLLKMFGRGAGQAVGGKPKPKIRRAAERSPVEGLQCTLGSVQDVSSSGLKVWSLREPPVKPGALLPLVLAGGDQRLTVPARVVWVRRSKGAPGWHMGFQFEKPAQELREALENYARAGYFTTDPEVRRKLHTAQSDFEPREQQPPPPPVAVVEIVNLYALLGVERSAPAEEIHSAYRRLARQLHPDSNPSAAATEEFSRMSKAYAVLRDPEKRSRYDQMLGGPRANRAA